MSVGDREELNSRGAAARSFPLSILLPLGIQLLNYIKFEARKDP